MTMFRKLFTTLNVNSFADASIQVERAHAARSHCKLSHDEKALRRLSFYRARDTNEERKAPYDLIFLCSACRAMWNGLRAGIVFDDKVGDVGQGRGRALIVTMT